MNAQIVDLAQAAHRDRERVYTERGRMPRLRQRWGARVVRWGERISGVRAGAAARPRTAGRTAVIGLG